MTELADRVFCIYNEPAGAKGRGRQRRGWPESRGRWRRTREKSATPFLPPRHYRKARGEFGEWLKQEVAKASEDHGLPKPVHISIMPRLVSTRREIRWLEFRRNRKNENPQIGYGLELTFKEPVIAPVTLGLNAHFGLGLFVSE